MKYDTTTERYSHLAGLTEAEIRLVMLIADVALRVARKELNHEERHVSPRMGRCRSPLQETETGKGEEY